MRKIVLILGLFTILLSGCGAPATPIDVSAIQTAAFETVIADVNKPKPIYTLINKELGSSTKCILDIRLPDRISEDEIKTLAEHLHVNEGASCSPLFIFYFLPDETPGQDTAWAYSHYNPSLEIQINGLDLETKATLEANKPNEADNLIGTWLDTSAIPHKIIIRKINGSYEMTSIYGDGSNETVALFVEFVNGEERLFEDPDNYFGDYMVIKENGNLAFLDKEGLIYELSPEQE